MLTEKVLSNKLRGIELLRNPYLNKGLSFSKEERIEFGLDSLLPSIVETLDVQTRKLWDELEKVVEPLNKYLFLENIRASSILLYHSLLEKHFNELSPIVYTPVVGDACLNFSKLPLTRNWLGNGLYITLLDKGNIYNKLKSWEQDDLEIIVLTDGGRILGLGDLGVNGMPIPIGKLSLYISLGGISPIKSLPIIIDIGTNNIIYLNDKDYLGLKQNRCEDTEYYEFMDEMLNAIFKRWPKVVLQWEDITTPRAIKLLDIYKSTHRVFNDDIQGTAVVTLAAILSALQIKKETLAQQKILIFGAGSASIGISNLIIDTLKTNGTTHQDACAKFFLFDSKGLINKNRNLSQLNDFKKPFVRNDIDQDFTDIKDAIHFIKPSILLGVSGQPNSFNKDVIQAMCKYNENPIIFALSNPTNKAECTAIDVYNWSNGKVIYASGSPMPSFNIDDHIIYHPTQSNNMYVFPGIGLGAFVGQLNFIPDHCYIAAAHALSQFNSIFNINKNNTSQTFLYELFPTLTSSIGRDISAYIAANVIITAIKYNAVNDKNIQHLPKDLMKLYQYIKSIQWVPVNIPYSNQTAIGA